MYDKKQTTWTGVSLIERTGEWRVQDSKQAGIPKISLVCPFQCPFQ